MEVLVWCLRVLDACRLAFWLFGNRVIVARIGGVSDVGCLSEAGVDTNRMLVVRSWDRQLAVVSNQKEGKFESLKCPWTCR